MNRRTLKKHCQRAMVTLIRDHRYKAADFSRARGDETLDAPAGMERRFVERSGMLKPGPLKGTPLLWEKASYEYDEWDCRLPSQVLADIEYWENLSDADIQAMLAEPVAARPLAEREGT